MFKRLKLNSAKYRLVEERLYEMEAKENKPDSIKADVGGCFDVALALT